MVRQNLFSELLGLHSGSSVTPRENFLSEVLAHLFRADQAACDAWLSRLLGEEIKGASCSIATRNTERRELNPNLFPDLRVEATFDGERRATIYCEHKWHAPCNPNQLREYLKIAQRISGKLCFACTTRRQRADAIKSGFVADKDCFLWEELFRTLDGIADKSSLLLEVLQFMKNEGLSPGEPITVDQMRSFLSTSDFLGSLKRLAEKLNDDYEWDVLPARLSDTAEENRYVHDAYGRIGIRFGAKQWMPALSAGFLYDETDHRVALLNKNRGIDLMLRIEVEPKRFKEAAAAIPILEQKRPALKKLAESVLFKGEPGNGNGYSFAIIRSCLGDVIEGAQSEAAQLDAIHKKLVSWLQVLFDDGTLERAFKKSGGK